MSFPRQPARTPLSDAKASGPDLGHDGIAETELAEDALLGGQVDGEAVLLSRCGGEVCAIGATCTHYGGPLAEGLRVGDTVRCPWHHAQFSLRSGEALAAPALTATSCWRVERRDGRIFVAGKTAPATRRLPATPTAGAGAHRMLIIGGGAAGYAAAEMLRRLGHGGNITIVSADADAPYDRPNLSKDYLAGAAPEEWIPLRPGSFYAENRIDLRLGISATGIDTSAHRVSLDDGSSIDYDRLLLATGAEPIRLQLPGATLPQVRTLRSLQDCREIIARARPGTPVVIVGASFIGLEAAAALRARQAQVHVVAPEARPMERVLGAALGDFLRALHESHGVVFHLERKLSEISAQRVRLDDGSELDAELVLVGIGVLPRLTLAQQAGLAIDRGVLVDESLRTSAADVFAAGDIARWPDPHSGERLRIEHWVVAQRQGQTAARCMLGQTCRYESVPFFWTQHYDVPIAYVGHASSWDQLEQSGDASARDIAVRFRRAGHTLAVATIFRDRDSLTAELALEQGRPA